MSSDYQAQIANICANPENLSLRLVLADWIEEHGSSGQDRYLVELIRLQDRLTVDGRVNYRCVMCDDTGTINQVYGCDHCRNRQDLRRREGELIQRLGLLAPFGGKDGMITAYPIAIRYGFVEGVATAEYSLLDLDELRTRAPIREVSLGSWPEIESTECEAGVKVRLRLNRLSGAACLSDQPGEWLTIGRREIVAETWAQMRLRVVKKLLENRWKGVKFAFPSASDQFSARQEETDHSHGRYEYDRPWPWLGTGLVDPEF